MKDRTTTSQLSSFFKTKKVVSASPSFFIAAFFSLFFCEKTAAQPPQVAAGRIVRIENFPSKFVAPRTIDIWLPDGFDPKKRYATLYFHDGQNLFDSTTNWNHQEWGLDESLARLMATGQIRPVIAIGVHNAGRLRHSEFFPQKPFERLPVAVRDSIMAANRRPEMPLFAAEVQSDNYLRFLVEELKPYIDRNYPTRPGRGSTFTAGSSMGGLISLYAVCEYPKIFGGAACLSTHWPGLMSVEGNPFPGALLQYLVEKLPAPRRHRFYFDHGDVGLDALYPPLQRRADLVFSKKGYGAGSFLSRAFPGADHTERDWRARLDGPMLFLLKK